MKKNWYLSKSVWGGVLVFIGGGTAALGFPELGTAIGGLGAGLGFVGLRSAMK